jgi:hypothetical protein
MTTRTIGLAGGREDVKDGPRIGRTVGVGQAARAKPRPDSAPKALPPSALSWERIVEIEPRLRTAELEVLAIAHGERFPRGETFCANAIWYGYLDPSFSFKKRVHRYTGWYAEKPELRSPAAYHLAYEHLYNLLPDCRGCMCA